MATFIPPSDLKEYLEEKTWAFNKPEFIEHDPISIPHLFKKKEDIEIAAFLSASIAWGNRKSILKNARKMILLLDDDPFNFIVNHTDADLKKIQGFVHRTFNLHDFLTFISCLKQIYQIQGGLENLFNSNKTHKSNLEAFPAHFFQIDVAPRTRKDVAKIASGSAGKRLNMFLRWMVRKDQNGVDFGIWKSIKPADLFIPLDVHSGNTARKLGLLDRKQNDWKAVKQLTEQLRQFDPGDPVKYDFALFGLGAIEGFN